MSKDSTGDGGGSQAVILEELYRVFEPVVTAARYGQPGIVNFIDDSGLDQVLLGQEVEKIISVVETELADPVRTIHGLVSDVLGGEGPPSLDDVEEGFDAFGALFDGFDGLDEIQIQSPDLENVGETIVDYLLVRYLQSYHGDVHSALRLTGVIEPGAGDSPDEIDLSAIPETIQDPNAVAAKVLQLAEEDAYARVSLLLMYLQEGLQEHQIQAPRTTPGPESLTGLTGAGKFDDLDGIDSAFDLEPQLRIDALQLPIAGGNGQLAAGIKLLPLPPGPSYNYAGLGLLPFGAVNFSDGYSQQFGPNDDWTFSMSVSGDGKIDPYGLVLRPGNDGSMDAELRKVEQGNPADVDLEAAAELAYDGTTESGDYRTLLGEPGGTRLALGAIAARTGFEYSTETSGDTPPAVFRAELPTHGKIEIKPQGGFLEKVLPEEIASEFDVTVGWSNVDGLYFEGGATLEVTIPKHVSLGPIDLKKLHLSIAPDFETGEIVTEASAAATVTLGPIAGTVDRMGIDATLAFPENRDGNLGPVDLELGFKPPEGVGLAIDAGPVTGSGYLFFDPDNERYAGAAQLKVSGISITAVGLITTELPDGSDGFSFLVVVAGEFPPIQLGFGFTLNGVGGLLGINRQFRKKPLRNAVRTGNLNSILFPDKELVKNNPQRIISDLRSIFPPKKHSYLFGPMVKLGYGTPPVLLASLGVVLEIPSFRVAIVGRFEVALPNHAVEKPPGMPKEAPWPPIELNLDVAGIIDVPGKSISIDASLYDSRVLQWSVAGDMALRSSWGEKSRFILSVGGFNPRYQPPEDAAGLANLDRVKVSLDVPGGQPVVEFTGYFAVTSNTFQVGAQVFAELNVGSLRIWGKLGFDALFQFKPFKFIFDFIAAFKIEAPAFTAGFKLDGTIKGPNPFNIRGTVSLTLGPIDVSTKIDLTIGSEKQGEALPPAEVLPELLEDLRHPKNWEAQRPDDGKSLVSLRGTSTQEAKAQGKTASEEGNGKGGGDQEVLAHPKGTLTVRQTVVPLEYTIEKFGENTPKTYDRFRLGGVTVAGEGGLDRQDADGEFAPAKYKQMSNADKLDSPDFVERTAGTTVGDTGTLIGGATESTNATRASFVYEERFTDETLDVKGEKVNDHDESEAHVTHTPHTAESLVQDRSSVADHDGGRFAVRQEHSAEADDDDGLFVVGNPGFSVVDQDTFEPIQMGDDGSSGSTSTAPMIIEDLPFRSRTATGLSKEEGQDLLAAADRADAVDADLTLVADHARRTTPLEEFQ